MEAWKMTDRRRAEIKAAIAKIEKAIEGAGGISTARAIWHKN